MSKAILGASLLSGALATGFAALELASGGTASIALLGFLTHTMEALALGGLSMEAAAIGDALTSNRGVGITTRQAAAYRQIVYGEQRVPGVIVYESTTGSSHDQYNYVIVLAGHEIDSIPALYLDGRRVYWQGSGAGWGVRNGIGFGGIANGTTYTGPDGNQYNFGGTGHSGIYAEARYGDQLPGDVIGALTANDPNWAASGGLSPSLLGCAYIYLKIEYNPTVFPNPPEIRVDVKGKNDIWDPRSNTRGWSCNSALCVADVIRDTRFGLGDVEAFQDAGSLAQLIAAANVCDEQVLVQALSATTPTYESRYCVNYRYDTGTPPGDAMAAMLDNCAGRITMPGGEWYIFPAYWQGPSFTFDSGDLAGAISWEPTRSQSELCNRVFGTYIAPGFPWNVAGNLYDQNGFYDGMIQNNFPFAFQPTDYPSYACDALHGYAADEYLNGDSGLLGAWSSSTSYNAGDVVSLGSGSSLVMYKSLLGSNLNNNPATCCDPGGAAAAYASGTTYSAGQAAVYGGTLYVSLVNSNTGNTPASSPSDWAVAAWVKYSNLLPMQLSFRTVQSVTQAQRLAKIALLRNRFQGSGDFPMQQAAFAMQCCDVMEFTFAAMGWSGKTLEVVGVRTEITEGSEDQAPADTLSIHVIETDPSIYDWDPATEELTVYDVPPMGAQQNRTPAPPTGMSLTSGASTALVGADGVVHPRIEVQWTTPADAQATGIQVQYQLQPAGTPVGPWLDGGTADVALNLFYLGGVVAGAEYGVRIRTLRAGTGAYSAWEEIDGYTVSITLSVVTQLAVANASLTATALSGGTAEISGAPFTVSVGNLSVSVAPGNYPLTGLNQNQLYDVYYVDPTFAGGAVTAIATQTPSDYLDKVGYFLIGSIVTPVYSGGGGGGGPYYPTSVTDSGSNPSIGLTDTGGYIWCDSGNDGEALWDGFSGTTTAATTLSVTAGFTGSGVQPLNSLQYSLDGGSTWNNWVYLHAGYLASTTYTASIASGTNLSLVRVRASCEPGGSPTASGSVSVSGIGIA